MVDYNIHKWNTDIKNCGSCSSDDFDIIMIVIITIRINDVVVSVKLCVSSLGGEHTGLHLLPIYCVVE